MTMRRGCNLQHTYGVWYSTDFLVQAPAQDCYMLDCIAGRLNLRASGYQDITIIRY